MAATEKGMQEADLTLVALDASLKKHVATIHISAKLGELARKACNIFLLQAYDDLLTKNEHSLRVSDFCILLGYNSHDYQGALKRALIEIATTPVEFNLMDDGEDDWSAMALISRVRIRKGIVTWAYDSLLAERLYEPDVFAVINLGVQRALSGSYTLSLYENTVRYRKIGRTGMKPVELWRRLLGAEADMYDKFWRFNGKVLKPAIEDINANSDIHLTMITEMSDQDSRRVARIGFTITENPIYAAKHKKQPPLFDAFMNDSDAEIKETDVYKRLMAHGISSRLAIGAIKHNPEIASAIIDQAEEKDRLGKIRTSPSAYIAKMLTDGVDPRPSAYEQEKKRKQTAKKEQEQTQSQIDRRKKLEENFLIAHTKATLLALTVEQRNTYAQEYLQTEAGQGKDADYNPTAGRFKSPLNEIQFHNTFLPKRAVTLPTEEEFHAWLEAKGIDPISLEEIE